MYNTKDREKINSFTSESYEKFWEEAKKFQVLSKEENNELAIKAKNGDKQARERLINCNLRLVGSIIKLFEKKMNHVLADDLLQEGCIGLMYAINHFNPGNTAFSSYAYVCIKRRMERALSNQNNEVRIPEYLGVLLSNYIKLLEEYEKIGEPIPCDADLCEMLGVTQEILVQLRENVNYKMVSLNYLKENEDGETREFGDLVGVVDNDYDGILDEMVQTQFLAMIKSILSARDYFVLYFRYISDNAEGLETLSKRIRVSYETIRQREKFALNKVKPLLNENSFLYQQTTANLKERCSNFELYNVNPILPENICLFLYLFNSLSDLEATIFYYRLFGKYKFTYYIRAFGWSEEEILKIYKYLDKKIQMISNTEEFEAFASDVLEQYGSKIFDCIDKSFLTSLRDNDMILKRTM